MNIIEKLVDFNDQMNFTQKLLAKKRAESNSFSKEELAGLSEAQALEVFAEKQEEALIEEDRPSQKETLAQIIARKRAEEAEMAHEPEPASTEPKEFDAIGESFSLKVVLNEKQKTGEAYAFQGKSYCLIGPAGSGKTTALRATAAALLDQGKLTTTSFKTTDSQGKVTMQTGASLAVVAYTRRAASNARKAIHKDPVLEEKLRYNITTIHALLEYRPETYWDSLEMKEKFRFAPARTAENPLTITHLVIEESSMLGLDLWEKLYDALPEGVQIIYVGDINQLPPVFGPSILNYALTDLPIVELTEVYRNQGIVLENAHRVLRGDKLIEDADFRVIRGNKPQQLGQERMSIVTKQLLEAMSEGDGTDGLKEYEPEHDIILSPFNKQHMGTKNMNSWIAQFVGAKRNAVVHEVIAGFNKLYLAVGDKVMVNKRDGVIKDIHRNPDYHGKEPQLAGSDLSRFGHRIIGVDSNLSFDDLGEGEMDYTNFSLEALEESQAERKQQASHCVEIDYGDGLVEEVTAAGDFAEAVFSLGYCLTIHKAQGSEFRKIILLMHKDHSVMLFRELLYTALTRARTKVDIVSKDYLIDKAIATQRIKGNTLKAKLAYFNSGINDVVSVSCTK